MPLYPEYKFFMEVLYRVCFVKEVTDYSQYIFYSIRDPYIILTSICKNVKLEFIVVVAAYFQVAALSFFYSYRWRSKANGGKVTLFLPWIIFYQGYGLFKRAGLNIGILA